MNTPLPNSDETKTPTQHEPEKNQLLEVGAAFYYVLSAIVALATMVVFVRDIGSAKTTEENVALLFRGGAGLLVAMTLIVMAGLIRLAIQIERNQRIQIRLTRSGTVIPATDAGR